jgi:hypothetical protein
VRGRVHLTNGDSIPLREILAILANNAGHFPGQGFHRGLLLHQEGMLAHGRVTSRLPSPAPSYHCPRAPSELSSLDRCRSKTAARFVQSKRYAYAVRQRRETTAQGQRASHIVRPPSSRFFAKLHTICWLQSSQCHRDASSRALNIIGRRSRTNLTEKSRNAVCLNGISHDDDSPDAASSDAAWIRCPCEIR